VATGVSSLDAVVSNRLRGASHYLMAALQPWIGL